MPGMFMRSSASRTSSTLFGRTMALISFTASACGRAGRAPAPVPQLFSRLSGRERPWRVTSRVPRHGPLLMARPVSGFAHALEVRIGHHAVLAGIEPFGFFLFAHPDP